MAMRVTSFRARLTLRWMLAVGALLGGANLAVYAGARAYMHRWLDHGVRTLAATETASATDGMTTDVHLHEGPFAQLGAGAFTEKFVQIFDQAGRVVLQSTGREATTPIVGEDALRAAFAGSAPLVWADLDGRRLRVAVLTASREGRRYAVAVGLSTDEVDAGLASLAWLLAGVWTVSLTASAGIGYVLASRALAPVARITEKAAWIADGNFDGRLDVPVVQDELGRMTTLLNSMLDRLRGALEANRRFAADASHELRGPLTAIAGEVDVALRHPRSAESYEETLRRVRGGLTALTQLAEDLILLVRTQEGSRTVTLRELALAPLVDESFRRVASAAAARGVTVSRAALEGIHVYAEPALIGRVLDNVIENAVHYNRDHGHVEVSAHVEEPPAGVWESPVVQIAVRDSGPGIPDGLHEQIFERFVRVDQARARHLGGSGLGLAICREVLKVHGGGIRVGASGPEGTAIEIRLPGRGAAAGEPGAAPALPHESHRRLA